MAGIRTKISVEDGMSNTLNAMYRAVSHLLSGFDQMERASKEAMNIQAFRDAQEEMAEALNYARRMEDEYNKIEQSIRSANTAQTSFNKSLKQGMSGVTNVGDRLTSSIRNYAMMAATAFGGKQVIEASDTSITNEARLGLLTDSPAETEALKKQILASANASRSVYSDTVDTVAKLGLLAGDSFSNNSEIVRFSELMQKSFAVSGASTMEQTAGMYQLSQAMAAGRLQGDEFRSIMENAPMLAQAIADFTDKSKGELKEMSAEGTITADIIKGALFSAADDIENKYSQLPMTFSGVWNNVISTAQTAFEPVYNMMSSAIDSEMGQGFMAGINENIQWFATLAQDAMLWMQNMADVAAPALSQLQSMIRGISSSFLGVNGIVQRVAYNISKAFANGGGTAIRVYANAVGNIAVALSKVLNVISPLLPYVTTTYVVFKMYQTVSGFISPIVTTVQQLQGAFNSATTAIQGATTAQRIFNTVCNANVIGFVTSAVAGLATAWVSVGDNAKYAAAASDAANASIGGFSSTELLKIAKQYGVNTSTAQQIASVQKEYEDRINAYKNETNANRYQTFEIPKRFITGNGPAEDILNDTVVGLAHAVNFAFGAGIEMTERTVPYDRWKAGGKYTESGWEKLTQYNSDIIKLREEERASIQSIIDNYNNINNLNVDDFRSGGDIDVGDVDNVNHINDTVDIASEDLRYMRELADKEAINQFTSKLLQPSINISFGEVKETADVDGIIDRIVDGLTESLNNSADLVHI